MKNQTPRVLCIDDEPMNLNLLDAILKAHHFDPVPASSGTAALDIIRRERIDIVLLDLMMPEMDGFEVCRLIKSDEHSRTIPVIMITAYSERKNRILGIEAGAEDFISKPFDVAEVIARINMLLKVKTLNDHLNSAYSNITNLIAFGEDIINTFDPLNFDFMGNVSSIVSQVIATSPEMRDRPQLVLVRMPEENGTCRWLRFEYPDKVFRTTLSVEIGQYLFAGEGGGPMIFLNENDLADPRLIPLIAALAESGIVPVNLVCSASEQLSLYAFNYGREVTRYDAEVLTSVVAQSQFLRSLSRQVRDTENAFAYTVHALARASELNDEDTGNHIVRVGHYSSLLAERIGMPEQFVGLIRLQAQMHDVGKIHTPPGILKKPGRLESEEFEIIKQHTYYGARILGDHIRLTLARSIAMTHHERYDGSGYPNGLKGDRIPIEGRIVTLADQYDALRNQRVYKPAFNHDTSVRIILEGDGRTLPVHFDPMLLKAFKELAPRFEEVYESSSDCL